MEDKRIWKMFYLLAKAEGYRNAGQLAEALSVSERTVKNDMRLLQALTGENGCEVESVRGKGYAIRVTNQIEYQLAMEKMDILFGNVEKGDKWNPIYSIARAVMMGEGADGDGYFRLETLAERLHFSDSDMKKKMASVRELLSKFNMGFDTRPGRGLRLEGDEFNRRICMLELYEIHYRKRVAPYDYDKFERAFDDRGEKEQVRNVVLTIARAADIHLLDNYLNRIVSYLNLMRNRVNAGFSLDAENTIWKVYRGSIRESREYRIAAAIFRHLRALAGFDVGEDEIEAVAVLLQIWSDWEWEEPLNPPLTGWKEEAERLSVELSDMLRRKWNLTVLEPGSGLTEKWIPGIIKILLQIHYGCSGYAFISNTLSHNSAKQSPLSMILADDIAWFLEERFGRKINEYNRQMLAMYFYGIIEGIPYPYIPRKVMICARGGMESGRILAENMIRHMGREWLETVAVCELYEGRKYARTDFDCVIGTFRSYVYRYDWPYVEVGQFITSEDIGKIHREVKMMGYDLDGVLEKCGWDTVLVHPGFVCGGIESLLQLLAYQWGKDLPQKENLARQLALGLEQRVCGNVMIVAVPFGSTGKRIFDLYILKKQLHYREERLKAVLFMAVDFGTDPAVLRFAEQISRCGAKKIDTLIAEAGSENIMNKLTEIIREEL